MASVTNLRYGSSGSEVKKLQEALISAGYDVGSSGADGVLGKNTEAAIKKYQKDNGLTVDGIAGKNTQGKLYATNTSNNSGSQNNAGNAAKNAGKSNTVTTATGFTYENFAPSDAVNQADADRQQHQTTKPGEYTPVWQDQADSYLNQYQNRDPFSYDFNSDALYNMYKDQYIQQGQMAMMDTMGQAAALTGGYGSSYAQTAGQQAYNLQLSQLNNIIPELYSMAYDRYSQEGQDLLNMYNIYMDREQLAYGQHQDTVDNWYREDERLTNNYNNLWNQEYDTWYTGVDIQHGDYNTKLDMDFRESENQKSRDFTASQNKLNRDAEIEAAAIKAASASDMNTEDTMTWMKRFSSATTVEELQELAHALEGVIGEEKASEWFYLYLEGIEDDDEDVVWVDPNSKAGQVQGSMGSAGGVYRNMIM